MFSLAPNLKPSQPIVLCVGRLCVSFMLLCVSDLYPAQGCKKKNCGLDCATKLDTGPCTKPVDVSERPADVCGLADLQGCISLMACC